MADSWLPFDATEYERRQQALRARMDERSLDVVLLSGPENQYYLAGYETTGFHSFPQTLIVPRSSPPLLVTRRIEDGNAGAAYMLASRGYRDDEDPAEVLALALRELGLAESTLGDRARDLARRVRRPRRHRGPRDGRQRSSVRRGADTHWRRRTAGSGVAARRGCVPRRIGGCARDRARRHSGGRGVSCHARGDRQGRLRAVLPASRRLRHRDRIPHVDRARRRESRCRLADDSANEHDAASRMPSSA